MIQSAGSYALPGYVSIRMMISRSIRWRLSLSYAAIALLTTLALGAVLLTTLQSYYQRQELNYLTNNARAIGEEIAVFLEEELPATALQSQVKGFAFLSQTRVRLFNAGKSAVMADSGQPGAADSSARVSVQVEVDGVSREFSQTVEQGAATSSYHSSIVVEDGLFTRDVNETVVVTGSDGPGGNGPEVVSRLPAVGTPYGFLFDPGPFRRGPRSGQVVEQPIYGATGDLLGYLELSAGPAYGGDILHSVAWGWAIASAIAVLVAAAAGWLVSRRLTAPLVALTLTTAAMAGGNLSARAKVAGQDELGELGRAFNKMAEQVEETVSTLRRFVADAAHELNTPLTALRTNLELLGQHTSGSEARERVERAQEQAIRLQALTASLLNLSRIEAEKAGLEYNRISLNKVVQSSSEVYASRAEQAALDFSLSLPSENIVVNGNERQMRQAIDNLLDNALKFTAGGGQIQVALEHGSGWATVTVADSGIGVPDEDVAHLFGRFHRGRNAAAYPGSGLGLAIVKAIVENHGGYVSLSNHGPGVRFFIRLPVVTNQRLE